ncbi:protein OSB3, chloroplastic/mitochondrial-like isoform X2 [Phragmites australis]|uniref:protein OSB3, chloroplastic/mitochondrial-like isoform X2 n=1 Tax=Phragmites australis TaxID=29695 RepID=UPI002D785887|nr:protein OSB3, chloroplastic/mitochondrial-like isoform X2 [Phragmites australis]
MHRHLSRLLNPRLFLLRSTTTTTTSVAAFSTSSKRPYARRDKPAPAEKAGDDSAAASSPAAAGAGAATWQREKLPSELPEPPTIPFQPRVANAVRLVGSVGAPVQMQRMPDGRFSAVSVLVQDRRVDFPKFWIPVIFQDDLAQVAASHLKENDLVYVSGQLTGDVPPFKLTDGQANIQVLAHLLSFVDSKVVEADVVMDEDERLMEVVEAKKKVEAKKVGSEYPRGTVSGYKNKKDKLNKLWNDVIAGPQDWIDNRPQKKNGSRSAKYPDFTNKVSKEVLWLDSAPTTVLEKLDDLVFGSGYDAGRKDKPFDNDTRKGAGTNWMKFRKSPDASAVSKQKLEADLWRDLVDNSENWWDNRSDKLTSKHPDFKHKESGQALWINTKSPQWAIAALPSLKFKGASTGTRKQETLLS